MKIINSLVIIICFLAIAPSKAQSIQKRTYEYAVKDGESLQIDVYKKISDNGSLRPVVLWAHGGGFSSGSRDGGQEVKLMNTLAEAGYVAISMSYRLLRKHQATGFGCDCPRSDKMTVFRESAYDMWDALLFIQQNATMLGIRKDQIVVGGSSAGAEIALNAVYMKDWLFEAATTDTIQPAIVWSQAGAVLDSRYIHKGNAISAVFFHGTADNLVPYATAAHHYCEPTRSGYIMLDGTATIVQRLKSFGVDYLFYTYEDAKHEIAGVQFEEIPTILHFFNHVFERKQVIHQEVIVAKK
jgi:predicted esterase